MKFLNKLKEERQDLINSLIENIESLEQIAHEQQAELDGKDVEIMNLKHEVERLQNERIERIRELTREVYDKEMAEAKSEAIKYFAKEHRKIMMAFCDDDDQISLKVCEYDANTNNLVKEMVGDDNA